MVVKLLQIFLLWTATSNTAVCPADSMEHAIIVQLVGFMTKALNAHTVAQTFSSVGMALVMIYDVNSNKKVGLDG